MDVVLNRHLPCWYSEEHRKYNDLKNLFITPYTKNSRWQSCGFWCWTPMIIDTINMSTILFWFVWAYIISFPVNPWDLFTHILQGYITALQCVYLCSVVCEVTQENMGNIDFYQTTSKHSKTRTMCTVLVGCCTVTAISGSQGPFWVYEPSQWGGCYAVTPSLIGWSYARIIPGLSWWMYLFVSTKTK